MQPAVLTEPERDESSSEALRWLYEPVEQQRMMRRPQRTRWHRLGHHLLVLLVLAPVLGLLASRTARLVDGTVLVIYGVGVLSATILVMYLAFGWYRDRSRGATLPASPPLVTCMVAVMNDADVIERCINSVLDSTYPNLELIVVDDCSDDGTVEIVRALADTRSFRFIEMPHNVGKKRALVRAAEEARGAVFMFTDSDCIVAPRAVEQCVKALLADPRLGAVSGHARALNANHSLLTKVQDTWYDGQFAVAKAAESVFGAVTCVSGPMAVFRREAVYNYLPAWADDSFLGREFRFATDRQLTAYVLGQDRVGTGLQDRYADSPFVAKERYTPRRWRVEYVSSARALTNVPETGAKLLRQQVRWKKSFIRNLFFTGGFLWRRGAIPSFLFYGHVLWVGAAPLLVFWHLVWLPAHGRYLLALLYLAGILFKGCMWALAYKVHNPGSSRWVYRPLMSLLSSGLLAWLLPYSAFTLRKSVWARG